MGEDLSNSWDGWNDAMRSILSDSTGYAAHEPVPDHIKQLCKEVWNLALRLQGFAGFLSSVSAMVRLLALSCATASAAVALRPWS